MIKSRALILALLLIGCNDLKEEKCVDTQVCDEPTMELYQLGMHRIHWRDCDNHELHNSIREKFGTRSYDSKKLISELNDCQLAILANLKDGDVIDGKDWGANPKTCERQADNIGCSVVEFIYREKQNCRYECR